MAGFGVQKPPGIHDSVPRSHHGPISRNGLQQAQGVLLEILVEKDLEIIQHHG